MYHRDKLVANHFNQTGHSIISVLLLLGILTCTFRTSRYSTHLSWAHTPVINWVVCLGNLLEVSEKEEGVVPLKTGSGLETVPRDEPSTYQPISR